MSKGEIQSLIPHRGPMLLVDEIVSRADDAIVCRKTFRDDEFFFDGHFPGDPIVPGVIQCECCLQAGALLLGAGPTAASGDADAAKALPVATRLDGVKFKRMVRPGDTVEIHVAMKDRVSNAYYMTGKMLLDGKPAVRLDFTCSLTAT